MCILKTIIREKMGICKRGVNCGSNNSTVYNNPLSFIYTYTHIFLFLRVSITKKTMQCTTFFYYRKVLEIAGYVYKCKWKYHIIVEILVGFGYVIFP
jgi:hypothetical protein